MGVRKALQQYRPEFVVYYAARSGTRYQLGMWLPYFERLNRRFIVITRHPNTVPEITELTSAPGAASQARQRARPAQATGGGFAQGCLLCPK